MLIAKNWNFLSHWKRWDRDGRVTEPLTSHMCKRRDCPPNLHHHKYPLGPVCYAGLGQNGHYTCIGLGLNWWWDIDSLLTSWSLACAKRRECPPPSSFEISFLPVCYAGEGQYGHFTCIGLRLRLILMWQKLQVFVPFKKAGQRLALDLSTSPVCKRRKCPSCLLYNIKWNTHILLLWYQDIFRPFVGYKEVRLVSKESKHVSQNSQHQIWFYLFSSLLLIFLYWLNARNSIILPLICLYKYPTFI